MPVHLVISPLYWCSSLFVTAASSPPCVRGDALQAPRMLSSSSPTRLSPCLDLSLIISFNWSSSPFLPSRVVHAICPQAETYFLCPPACYFRFIPPLGLTLAYPRTPSHRCPFLRVPFPCRRVQDTVLTLTLPLSLLLSPSRPPSCPLSPSPPLHHASLPLPRLLLHPLPLP